MQIRNNTNIKNKKQAKDKSIRRMIERKKENAREREKMKVKVKLK